MIKNKTLFKNISLFLCLVPMLILSIFCLIPNTNLKGVYALDDVSTFVEFNGSDFITFSTYKNHPNNYVTNVTINVGFKFSTFGNNFAFYCDGYGYSLNSNGNLQIADFDMYKFGTTTIIPADTYTTSNSIPLGSSGIYYLQIPSQASSWGVKFSAYTTSNFNANVYGVEIGTRSTFDLLPDFQPSYWQIFYFKYFSNIDKTEYCEFEFYTPISVVYNTRTYYFSNSFSGLDGYAQGFENGYNAGVTDGSNTGYQDGYNAGQTIGYQDGYNAGVEHGGNYTFLGLIGAVIDAPVSAFTSLLNFNILGVNILGFVTGLLTLALIIFIIKLCMGGK